MLLTSTLLVTGGAGFIGSNFVRCWLKEENQPLLNLDKLTYAGNRQNLSDFEGHPRYQFVHADMGDREKVSALLEEKRPSQILHFAAETHVDRSIHAPDQFVNTNILAAYNFLDEVYKYWQKLSADAQKNFRFINVSTDEVFGTLTATDKPRTATSPYAPNSPYAASKAGFDHFVRAYRETYGLPTLTSYCSNNFGPYQFPEKLIPLVILHALEGKELPLYGDGQQMRDWLYVEDHCAALMKILKGGQVGKHYVIASGETRTNLELVEKICTLLDELQPASKHRPHHQLIRFVKDRPGHDRRYALDPTETQRELNWKPRHSFEEQLRHTVQWYLSHPSWLEAILHGEYRHWIAKQYG